MTQITTLPELIAALQGVSSMPLSLGLNLSLTGTVSVQAGFSQSFTTGSLPSEVTLTRASSGTRFNSSGVLVSEATDVARFDYDPVTLAAKGLLIEPAATNVALQSSDFTHGSWSVYDCTRVGVNAGYTAPDGTTGVMELAFGTAGGDAASALYQTLAAGAVTVSQGIWVRTKTGSTTARLEAGDVANASRTADLPVTTTWTRLTGTLVLPGNVVQYSLRNNVAGTTGTILVWGADCQPAGAISSHIPTVGSTVTRAKDEITVTIPAGYTSLLVTYDDDSTSSVACVTGANVYDSDDFSRLRIKSLVGVA